MAKVVTKTERNPPVANLKTAEPIAASIVREELFRIIEMIKILMLASLVDLDEWAGAARITFIKLKRQN